ncbi:MAG: glutaredoxin domain-containing protein [Lachnospiraceae bacterium]|nr:glutaredoxin domain-containing protein [Lachnospiraceae bacterium]
MNIQIFGTKKCNDTKKAQRFFKERNMKFQFIDLNEKEISKGEFRSVCQAVGGMDEMIDGNCKDRDALALVQYIAEDEREEKLLMNPQVLKTPMVRNGKQATVGYQPEVWKAWS